MKSNTAWQRLCECLGLSEYEAKLYVSLIEQGGARARTLSVVSGVPRTKVYSVLKKLIDMGLVVEIPEEPRKFAPTPPKTAFKSYIQSYRGMVNNLLSVVSSLEEISRRTKSEESVQQGTLWTIYGRQEILKKMQQMLSKAKRSVQLVADDNGMVLLYKSFNRLFDELAERSVKVKIVTPNNSVNQHFLGELRYTCKIEEADFQLPMVFACVDEKQLLLASFQPNTYSLKSDHDRGIFSDNAVLLDMICLLMLRWRQ